MTLPLFDDEDVLPPQAMRLAPRLRPLAERGIAFGTSSWKYEGWLGQIYTRERYLVRRKFSHRRFEAECLREYAATFPLVGGDFSFYRFPTADQWDHLFAEVPSSLRFALKVPEQLTVAAWPSHPRYGARAGSVNGSFLEARLLEQLFTRPLERYRDRIAVLILEFGAFSERIFARPRDFTQRLDSFLGVLPQGFRYAAEIRNPDYLAPEYLAMLASHNVAHVFNAWTHMPGIAEQIEQPGVFTADFTVVRALLRRGRPYDEAVRMFAPYARIQERDGATRDAMRRIVDRSLERRQPAFLLVNNRLEGNAPGTIEAIVSGEGK